MLTLTPTAPIYFCVQNAADLDYGVPIASFALTDDSPRSGQYAAISVRDSKDDRIINVQEHAAAVVYIREGDDHSRAYVTWYSDGTVGIDCPDEVKILRQRLMIDCGFKPQWEYER